MKRKRAADPLLTVEPQYCPEAVQSWATVTTRRGKSGETNKAKNHLSYLGWKFWYAAHKNELRYESPTGEVYYSLRTACKSCVQEEFSKGSESVGSNFVEGLASDVSKEEEKSKKESKKRKIEATLRDDDGDCVNRRRPKQQGGKVLADVKRLKETSCGLRPREIKVDKNKSGSNSLHARNPRVVLSRLIDTKVVLPNTKVYYKHRKVSDTAPTTGELTREGIKCDCCGKVLSLTKFEEHAGSTNHRPSQYIMLEDGRSLLDCQKQVNDDICSLCRCGGVLILCDKCPSAFHASCLGLGDDVGEGEWFCPLCLCGICGDAKYEQGNGRDGDDANVLVCGQCERKCHMGCLKNEGVVKLGKDCEGNWFCSAKCEEVFLRIDKIVGKPIVVGPNNLTWTLLKPPSSSSSADYSKLNEALSVLHKCFDPCIDPYANIDIHKAIIFSMESNLSRLNFKRFYTVVLERDDEVVTVGNVRIYSEVAEVPLIATDHCYQRLGMCGVWMKELEKQLVKLGVGRLTLPSMPSTLDIWTGSTFGFSKMTDAERLEFAKYTLLTFPDMTMCQKFLKQTGTTAEGNGSAISTLTQEEQIQPENIAEGDELLSDDTDRTFLDSEDHSLVSWLSDLG